MGLVGLMPPGALFPSKSGLMNKHIVKHIVAACQCIIDGVLEASKSGPSHTHIVKHIAGGKE